MVSENLALEKLEGKIRIPSISDTTLLTMHSNIKLTRKSCACREGSWVGDLCKLRLTSILDYDSYVLKLTPRNR